MPFITAPTLAAWTILAVQKAGFPKDECQVSPENQVPSQSVPPSAPISHLWEESWHFNQMGAAQMRESRN